MSRAPFGKTFRNLDELAEFLEEAYPEECIKADEMPHQAQRRAGQVEVAQRIVASVKQLRKQQSEGGDLEVEID